MLQLATAALSFAAPPNEVHPERVAQIEEIRAASPLWKAAANPRFAREAPGEGMKPLLGVLGDWKADIEAQKTKGEVHTFPFDKSLDIPTDFDSAKAWPQCEKTINDIRDQSACGCCWAFAGAEAASDRLCIATNASTLVPLSSQDICFCGPFAFMSGCNGGQISSPWQHITSIGVVTGGQNKGLGPFGEGMCLDFSLPHCHHHGPTGSDPYPAEGTTGCPQVSFNPKCDKKCDATATGGHTDWAQDKWTYKGQTQSASGEQQIQQMLMQGGPVETAFTVFYDFENYAGGIYHHVSGGEAGGHAVKFVGWGVGTAAENHTKYWKVANSWNPYWGEKGYFRIQRGTNEGGIEDSVIGSAADATWQKLNA
jgi:cathepsin B